MVESVKISNEWTLIASNPVTISFQNSCQWPVYLGHSESDVEVPAEDYGPVYKTYDREYKIAPSDIFYGADVQYLWARTIGNSASELIVDYDTVVFTSYVVDGYVDTDYVVA